LKSQFPQLDFSDPKRIIMLGDSLVSDIAGANANGLSSALVLTGVTSLELLENAPETQIPDMVFTSI
jgi:ribonucleotide monophosphatase NagD (HAD superfamily)